MSDRDRNTENCVNRSRTISLSNGPNVEEVKGFLVDNEKEIDTSGLVEPPDGGWGWVIVAVGFLTSVIVDGVIFSFGIIFPEMLLAFDEGKSKTAWVGSLMAGLYMTVGPIVSAMANRFGCRPVAIAGSLLASTAIMVSYFATGVNYLMFTYGVLGGTGFGFIYLPCLVMVQFYFDKRRAFANGITVCGSGVGAFVFAPLSNYLISEYGWRQTILLQGAIVLHCAALAGLLRPLKPKKLPIPQISVTTVLLEQTDVCADPTGAERHYTNRKQSAIICSGLVPEPIKEEEEVEQLTPPPTYDEAMQNGTENGKEDNVKEKVDDTEKQVKCAEDAPINGQQEQEDGVCLRRIATASAHLNTLNVVSGSGQSLYAKRRQSLPVCVDIHRPFYRQDIFYSGSLTRIPQYASQSSLQRYHSSVISIPRVVHDECRKGSIANATLSCCPKPMRDTVAAMLDMSLLKSPTFMILCISSFLTMCGFFVPFVYLAGISETFNIDRDQATHYFALIGVFNTLGRVFSGWVSDRPKVDALFINNIALTVGGILTAFVPILAKYELLMTYSAIFGLSIACFASLRSIILVELLGLEKLTNSFGLLMLFQGIASIIGSPMAGAFYDLTGTYNLSFFIAGSLIAISGIMCFPLKRISRWEKRRTQQLFAA